MQLIWCSFLDRLFFRYDEIFWLINLEKFQNVKSLKIKTSNMLISWSELFIKVPDSGLTVAITWLVVYDATPYQFVFDSPRTYK